MIPFFLAPLGIMSLPRHNALTRLFALLPAALFLTGAQSQNASTGRMSYHHTCGCKPVSRSCDPHLLLFHSEYAVVPRAYNPLPLGAVKVRQNKRILILGSMLI